MVAGIFYEGSGLGDQLFRYVTVRTIAEEKGYEYKMFQDNFKGDFFIEKPDILKGDYKPGIQFSVWKTFDEKDVREHGTDIRSYDPEINFVEDNTIIDGSFEDDKYWRHNLPNIDKWLAVGPLNVPDDVCVIGFRGGEYAMNPDLFLGPSYYMEAIEEMLNLNAQMQFEVHTDDPTLAAKLFPNFKIIENAPISHSKHTNMGLNWRSARHAKYAIIPNSAFFILPRILKHHDGGDRTDLVKGGAVTISPRYWARRNTKTWARPACYYPEFIYI